MKAVIFSLIIVISCFTKGFAQSNSKQRLNDNEKFLAMREKFDPTRDPNLDLQNAIAQAQKENKRIILDIGGEWCVWCIRMDVYLMQNRSLDAIKDKNFVWIKVNMSEENENTEFLTKYPEIPGYPHLYVLEADGTILHSQNTAKLEKGKSYNLTKFSAFLKKWSRKKK